MFFKYKNIKKRVVIFITLFLFTSYQQIYSQNTVGVISYSPNETDNGYTLFSLHHKTYLINNCGEVINTWQSNYPPGNAVYLLENSDLLRAGKTNSTDIVFGGVGGRIEKYNWNGDLIWSMNYDSSNYRQHHDIYPMPNGNILILAATIMPQYEAIQAGRNPNLILDGNIYNEQIIEIEPVGTNSYNIVWEWNIKDHLIQDFDNLKDNFGIIELHPEKLNFNFLNGRDGNSNWLHINSIQYNQQLDQIIMSSRNLSEVYIIDHSTTTMEASTGFGGQYNKGGDFLYRWGNPQAYNQGDENDRKLYGQHYPHWIPNNYIDENKIILFNNGFGRQPSFSEVFIIDTPVNNDGTYTYTNGTSYLPLSPDYIYTNNNNFYSAIVSSAQRLPNGNTLICEGRTGEIIEINQNDDIVWNYITPANNITGQIYSTTETPISNTTFRAIKYPINYSGFNGRNLTPSAPIELNPSNNCTNLNVIAFSNNSSLSIWPNPTNNIINYKITPKNNTPINITLHDIGGRNIYSKRININNFIINGFINIKNYKKGVYILTIEQNNIRINKRIIIY